MSSPRFIHDAISEASARRIVGHLEAANEKVIHFNFRFLYRLKKFLMMSAILFLKIRRYLRRAKDRDMFIDEFPDRCTIHMITVHVSDYYSIEICDAQAELV